MNDAETAAELPLQDEQRETLTFLDVVTLWLSIYVLVVLAVQSTIKLTPETNTILDQADYVVCVVFFIDFCRRFLRAPSKARYMRWGWLDLLACVPMVDALRAGRLYRLWRLVRLVRLVRSWHGVARLFIRKRAQNTFAIVTASSFIGVTIAAVVVMSVEKDPASNIKSTGDAIWWAFCTVTTVGYGDHYPVTTEGRMVAVVLMTLGVGLFGAFAAYLGSLFLTPQSERKQDSIDALEQQVAALRESLARMEEMLREKRGE